MNNINIGECRKGIFNNNLYCIRNKKSKLNSIQLNWYQLGLGRICFFLPEAGLSDIPCWIPSCFLPDIRISGPTLVAEENSKFFGKFRGRRTTPSGAVGYVRGVEGYFYIPNTYKRNHNKNVDFCWI